MIMDKLNEFVDATATTGSVAAAAGTINVGNTINILAAGLAPELGAGLSGKTAINTGDEIYLVITVDSADLAAASGIITGGVAGTIAFRLVSDDSATPSTTTATVHYTSRAFVTGNAASTELPRNTIAVVVQLPCDQNYEQFLGIQAVIGTTTITEGRINAFLTRDARKWKPYQDALDAIN